MMPTHNNTKQKANNMNTQDTFPFKLIIKDYDLLTPLKNKEIQITNIDSKQCYESKITTANGEVIFEIPQNERGDFFSVELINDDDYEINPYYLAKESNNVYIQSPHSQESNQDFNQESNNVDSSNFNNSNSPNYSNNPSNSNSLNSSSSPSNSSNFNDLGHSRYSNILNNSNNLDNFNDSSNFNNSNSPNYSNNPNNPSNLNNSNSFSNSNNQKHSNNPHSAHLAHTTNTKSIYQSKNTTNKILTPNNYQKYPATLYFKAKIYLYFNGFTLSVMQGNKEIASYESRTNETLENGTYFINTQEIKDLPQTHISNNSNPNNIDSTKCVESNSHLSLNVYNDTNFTQTHCKICDNTQEAVDNNIYSNNFFANIDKIIPLINIMQYVKCIIDYKPNLIKSVKIQKHYYYVLES